MPRPTVTVCRQPGCPELRPCPTPGHEPEPWAGSRRKERRASSGWQEQRDAKRILKRHNGICHVCGLQGADRVDHVIPLAEGGQDVDANKRPIHNEPCHRRKTADEAARGRGRRG